MKPLLTVFLLLVFGASLFLACRKDQNYVDADLSNERLIESARAYFENTFDHSIRQSSGSYRIDAAKTVDWQAAKVLSLSQGPTIVVPVIYHEGLFIKTNISGENVFSLNDITHLVIYKDRNKPYHIELVTAFPDSAALKNEVHMFTGIIFVENWEGQRVRQLKFNTDGTISAYNDQNASRGKASEVNSIQHHVQPDIVVARCYTIYGYNYTNGDPNGGYAWSEPGGCSYMYLPDNLQNTGNGGTGGTGGAGGLPGSSYGLIGRLSSVTTGVATVTRGPNIIGNIQDYLKCFTNVGGADHTYTVTVCIDQPVSGTRLPWRLQNGPNASSAANNPVDVGHTFLIFSEAYGGNTITRNVGFYPRTGVNPWFPSDQGQLNNNEGSGYNISLTLTITNAQFFNILNYVAQGNSPGYTYDLNGNNCTTFAIKALQAGGVNLSSQLGIWFKGSGYDPGDFGEDIRNMPLSSNMTRSTAQSSHPNVGNCN